MQSYTMTEVRLVVGVYGCLANEDWFMSLIELVILMLLLG